MKKKLDFEIVKHFGVLAEKSKGWKKEVNMVSWNNAEPKFDIRDWSPEHDMMGKGITLTEEELKKLQNIIKEKILTIECDSINLYENTDECDQNSFNWD